MKRIVKMNMGVGDMIKLTSFSDAGHGWLSCKLSLLTELGIADKITPFSYINGKSVYLEEDLDAGILLNKLNELNRSYKIVEGKWQQYSRIRGYQPYKPFQLTVRKWEFNE